VCVCVCDAQGLTLISADEIRARTKPCNARARARRRNSSNRHIILLLLLLYYTMEGGLHEFSYERTRLRLDDNIFSKTYIFSFHPVAWWESTDWCPRECYLYILNCHIPSLQYTLSRVYNIYCCTPAPSLRAENFI